jgi:hypothetical protein
MLPNATAADAVQVFLHHSGDLLRSASNLGGWNAASNVASAAASVSEFADEDDTFPVYLPCSAPPIEEVSVCSGWRKYGHLFLLQQMYRSLVY